MSELFLASEVDFWFFGSAVVRFPNSPPSLRSTFSSSVILKNLTIHVRPEESRDLARFLREEDCDLLYDRLKWFAGLPKQEACKEFFDEITFYYSKDLGLPDAPLFERSVGFFAFEEPRRRGLSKFRSPTTGFYLNVTAFRVDPPEHISLRAEILVNMLFELYRFEFQSRQESAKDPNSHRLNLRWDFAALLTLFASQK